MKSNSLSVKIDGVHGLNLAERGIMSFLILDEVEPDRVIREARVRLTETRLARTAELVKQRW